MKKFAITVLLILSFGTQVAFGYNFGDYRSVTLTTKAWDVLEKGDIEAVLAFTNKCIELYGEQAKIMQAGLSDYPAGANQEIFAYWALNDVATSLFIQGEAYRKANMMDEAKEVYKKLINEYSYGQCWDPKGWFWKPADAAKEKLVVVGSGSNVDFGDYTSETLIAKTWAALNGNDIDAVGTYVDKILELYGEQAREMQSSLTGYPWESNDKIFSYWALNDVGTSLFIKGEALKKAGKMQEAKKTFQKLIDEYTYAQCWDPQGWFWKPAEAAEQKIDNIEEME